MNSTAVVKHEAMTDEREGLIKRCSSCGESFPATTEYFHKKKSGKYGLNCYCRGCNKARALTHHYANHEARLEYLAEYRERNRETLRQYKRNPDKQRAYNSEYYWANAEKLRLQARNYYYQHKPVFISRARQWARLNPDKVKAYTRVKALRRRGAPMDATAKEYVEVISSDPCVYCGGRGEIVIDHIHAISVGGKSEWDNLTPACRSCNAAKTNKSLLTFLQEKWQ